MHCPIRTVTESIGEREAKAAVSLISEKGHGPLEFPPVFRSGHGESYDKQSAYYTPGTGRLYGPCLSC